MLLCSINVLCNFLCIKRTWLVSKMLMQVTFIFVFFELWPLLKKLLFFTPFSLLSAENIEIWKYWIIDSGNGHIHGRQIIPIQLSDKIIIRLCSPAPSQPRRLGFFKDCVRYIFARLLCMSKKEHFSKKKKCFLFHFESSFRSWVNQIITFQILKYHEVIKCLSMKHETF